MVDVYPFPCVPCRKNQEAANWDWKGKTAKVLKRITLFMDVISFLLDSILLVTLAGKGMAGPAVLLLAAILIALTGACFIKSALGKKRFWIGLLLSELYIYLIEDTSTILLYSNVDGAYDPTFVPNVINVFVKCAGAAMIAVPLFCISSTYLIVALVQGSRDDVTSSVILALGSVPVVAFFSFFIYMLTGVVYSQNARGVVEEKLMITLYALSVIVALCILVGVMIFRINTRASGSQMSKTRSLSKISKMESFREEVLPTTYEQDHDAVAVNPRPPAMDRDSNLSSSEESMPSIDYDYSGAFRDRGPGTVVSSAGGTAGSTTHSRDVSSRDVSSQDASSQDASSQDASSQGACSGHFADSNSQSSQPFDNNSQNSRPFDNKSYNSSVDNNSGKTPVTLNSTNAAINPILLANGFKVEVPSKDGAPRTKEIFLDVYAPPGKLGIIIDRDESAIFVHTIKARSILIGKLFAGDKLIAIDDECIRMKTVKEVSRMVAERNSNPTRKLRVIRSVPRGPIDV